MKNRTYSWIFTAILVITGFSVVLTGSVAAQSTGFVDLNASDLTGTGTDDNPYIITNASELQAMEDNLDANYVLSTDINASTTARWNDGKGFDPVGNEQFENRFKGKFNGNNRTITGLTINRSTEDNVGLFGVTNGIIIQNINLKKVEVTGYGDVGGLIGHNTFANVENVSVRGRIAGETSVGGVVGYNRQGVVTYALSESDVYGYDRVGGLVGENWGSDVYSGSKINNSKASGYVDGGNRVGGFVGENSGTIQNSSADVARVNGSTYVGGFAGQNVGNYATIKNAKSIGLASSSTRIGGLVGYNNNELIDSFAGVSIIATGSSPNYAGALVGLEYGSKTDLYWNQTLASQPNPGSEETGLTGAQMTGEAAKTNMSGLRFGDVWQTQSGGYPDIVSQPPVENRGNDNIPPEADAGVNMTIDNGTAVNFNASGSSDNVGIVSYQWAFGDGTTATGITASHTYEAPGNYTATLTVTDDAGNTDTATVTITVDSNNNSKQAAEFRINSVNASTPVTAGEAVTITTTVENTGDTSGTTTVSATDTTLGIANETVSLRAGETTTLNLTLQSATGNAGEYTATVTTENDSASISVLVEAQSDSAQVQLSKISLTPQSVDPDSRSTHQLTFRAQNVSADGSEDEFDIKFPDKVDLVSYSDVAIDEKSSNVNREKNTLEFSVNATGGGSTQISGKLNVTVSATN